MNIGIFTNTPAHAHLYRACIDELEVRNHDVTVFARDDGPTLALLDYHDISYRVYGSRDITTYGLVRELPGHLHAIARHVRDTDLDLVLGMGVYSTFAALLARSEAITVMDSEPMATIQRLGAPFVSAFLTPSSFRRDLGKKHYVFDGFKETAYLHPDVFERDPTIRADLGLGPEEPFVLVRFNAFNGHHDVGHRGFDDEQKRRLVSELSTEATVLVSDESDQLTYEELPARPYGAHPARIHDALAEAELLIADTQTMVTEAALLGTPAIRSNSFVGENDMGNFRDLEAAGLVCNLDGFEDVMTTATELLQRSDTADAWARKREQFLADKCNLTAVLVDLVERCGAAGSVPDALRGQRALRPRGTEPV